MTGYNIFLVALGILPTAVIMFIILKNAVSKKEPFKKVASVFAISALSVVPAAIAEAFGDGFLQGFMAIDTERIYTLDDVKHYLLYQFLLFVLVVGVAEEACKFFTFKWIIFHDRDFDNTYDGIIYGAASALGFATLENLMYIFQSDDSLQTAIMRALMSIPLHAVTGIFMGYYFGVSKYRKYNNVDPDTHPEIPAYIFSVILHGLYDYSVTAMGLMYSYDEQMETESTETILYALMFIAIMIVCYLMIIITIIRAKKHSYNIYNRYYYEHLGGAFQDTRGGKTSDKMPTLFGVPLPVMYSRRPDRFNPYDPYASNAAPPPQYGQQFTQNMPQYSAQQYTQYQQSAQPYQQPPYPQPKYQQHDPYSQPQQPSPYVQQPQYQKYDQPQMQGSCAPVQTVRVKPKPVAPAEPVCRFCGSRNPPGSKYCSVCGNNMTKKL